MCVSSALRRKIKSGKHLGMHKPKQFFYKRKRREKNTHIEMRQPNIIRSEDKWGAIQNFLPLFLSPRKNRPRSETLSSRILGRLLYIEWRTKK